MTTKSRARSVPNSVAAPQKPCHPLRRPWRIGEKRSLSKRYVNRICKEERAISIFRAARRKRLNKVIAIARRRLAETGNGCAETNDLQVVMEVPYIGLR